jgi:hypothetical protein
VTYHNRDNQRAAHAKKTEAAAQPRRVPLGKARRITASQAEVNAKLRHDSWLLHEWRRRDPAAFRAAMGPLARTDLGSHASWSPDEQDDTAQLIRDADKALTKLGNDLLRQGKPRLILELRDREAALKQRLQAIKMRPARLLQEIEALERSLRWTPLHHQRRAIQLLLNATRAEARRRGLLEERP